MKECQLCKHCYTDDVATCPNDGMPTMHTLSGPPVLEGKYHLDLRLGQGGMGVVYKARHAFLKTLHAIKIILPDLVGNDPQLVTRFRQEALAAAAVRHQNVVGVSDYGVINGNIPFLVMEYVEGESLHDMLTREKSLDPERALDLISAICAGVGAAHHQGIVHRDLKPLNIMICNDKPSIAQAVKILDFGLAKIKSGELLGSFIQAQTTGLMGSPYYMAPEQWADDEPDSRSDIYSIGVMLFQMLAGDVPFKGSSIPAIMKKHISDPPPSFAAVGVNISPEIEAAVMHTLQKEPERRTPTVEKFVEEFKDAVYPPAIGIHTTSGGALPVSSLRIRSNPGQSKIFVDSIPVGETRENGWLLLEGIQSGNHHIRLTHDGFQDWTSDLLCDGQPQQVMVELRPAQGAETFAIPKPGEITGGIPVPQRSEAVTEGFQPKESDPSLQRTVAQRVTTGNQEVVVRSQPPKKKWFLSPIVIGTAAVVILLGLGAVGLLGAFMLGLIGKPPVNGNIAKSPTPTPGPTASPAETIKADLAAIPGGTFKMGNNQGRPNEQPEHDVQVAAFKMDKAEVTNAEFLEFMTASKYTPASPEKFLAHWVNGKPVAGQEKMPVRYVSYDDAKAYADWRSKRDSVTYRLPTESEWEFAARNGTKGNLYPWGDKFDPKCAVIDSGSEPAAVASKSCADDWGIKDLIGNVWEWTSSEASLYPGNSSVAIAPHDKPVYMIRGGSYFEKSSGPTAITATFRADVAADRREPNIGFRVVTAQ
jgi:serine/threonine protein kinase/formylglycine-generating enzyme required for sulfatase activity